MTAFVGIDVGTGSARAGVFDEAGQLLAHAARPIKIWHEDGGIVEQSSDDIWSAVSAAVREAGESSGLAPREILGIGFDATCSLVVVDEQGGPLAVGSSDRPTRNVIVWMDHRATDQADRINASGHDVLRYVGGRISPEMETPKLLWLKEMLPNTFDKAAHFFDLADFLSYRATGNTARSLCTVVCKWTYLGHERRWDSSFLDEIGLGNLADEQFRRIGREILDVGVPVGAGLSAEAAAELGLVPGTPVGASLIDAHSGGVGTLGGRSPDGSRAKASTQMALILGTSSCTMTVTQEPAFVAGVWGPYFGAMLPDMWLNEGGQSAFGAALDYIVAMHPAFSEASNAANNRGQSLLDYLAERAIVLAKSVDAAALLARDIQIVPEFLGNRSPEADPDASAVLAGLRLESGIDNLVRLYVAGLCGLCYGIAAIVDALAEGEVKIDTIVVSGGAARSRLVRRILSDATGVSVALPCSDEPVLLGSAMLGSVASGVYSDLEEAAGRMVAGKDIVVPQSGKIAEFHAAKRKSYQLLQRCEREIRTTMSTCS